MARVALSALLVLLTAGTGGDSSVPLAGTAVALADARGTTVTVRPSTKILFLRPDIVTGRDRVFVVRADGSGQHRTTLPSDPVFSPNGKKLAYSLTGRLWARLFVADVSGRSPRMIMRARPGYSCLRPNWSPDSRKLLYTVDCDVDRQAIGVVNADGSGRRRLTGTWTQNPRWSPDGRTIAFTGSPRPPARVAFGFSLMDDHGRDQRPIRGRYVVPEVTPNDGPTWTRDGRSILYLYDHVEGLCVVNRDGSGFRELVPGHKVRNFDLHGTKLVISASGPTDRGWEIYVLGVDGSGLRRLTENRAHDTEPKWSPDGRMIAFTSFRDGNAEIYVMNADGTGQTNVTRQPAHDERPAWVPSGSAL